MMYKMNLDIIRQLASSVKWQNRYSTCKDLHGFRLFSNVIDLTVLQQSVIYWLSVYCNLYTDLSLSKKNISIEVIKDHIRCDSYLYWRKKQDDKSDNTENDKKQKSPHPIIPKIIFANKGSDV